MYVWSVIGSSGRKYVLYTDSFHSALSLSKLSHVTKSFIQRNRMINEYNREDWKLISYS